MTTVADNDPNVEVRLGHVETRLDGVEGRLGNVETQVVELARRTGNVETLVANLAERVSRLEGRVDEMSKGLQDVRAALRHVQIVIWGLAAAMLTGMGGMSAALVAVALRI